MPTDGLSVAVTGPTGDLGIALVDALEKSRRVKKIVGMARRPFDPADQGWKKTEYRQGDVQDKKSVAEAVKGADVVVHLAFAILSASEATRAINIDGSRNVFEAAVEAGAERICYASSVAAYGFHDDNPDWLTEDIEPRGTREHFYSQQKAEVETVLAHTLLRTSRTHAWVFRPCIVAGPKAQTLLEEIPYFRMSEALPDQVRGLLGQMPVLKPVIPDSGNAVPARARRRRRIGVRRRRAGEGIARPLQPRRQRQAADERPGRRARLVLGAAAPRRLHDRSRPDRAAAEPARNRRLDPLRT